MKKADISVNTIVYAAIALLILVILVAFATGKLGQLFSFLNKQTGEEIGNIRDVCTTACSDAKLKVDTSGTGSWKISSYCTTLHNLDMNGDKKISSDERLHCYDDKIGVQCETTIGNTVCNSTSVDCHC